ncbi:MAG: hypothetical protein MPJ50_09490 [Pirellulales bacterium]|nr:hypothetical protein [Pirellulales bacterium]
MKDWDKLLGACTPPFDQLVAFSLLTGTRPQESRLIEAKHVKNETIVLPIADSKGNRKNQVIHLSEAAKRLVKPLCKRIQKAQSS